MNVYLNKISGIDDAITSMYFSKRSWTRDKENDIRDLVHSCTNSYSGKFEDSYIYDCDKEKFNDHMKKLCKWGKIHCTMLRFIDLSVTVENIHRAGQDDWDSHAKRFDNRIIRASTRLADFSSGEMSDYYKGKIIPTDLVCERFKVELPTSVILDGKTFVKTVNGYIRDDLKNNRDVKRGLYMESIPSSFIFKINLTEWAHVYRERNEHGTANPEVKELAESIQEQLEKMMPWFTKEFILSIQTD